MKAFLFAVVLILAGIVAVGFYRGWFGVTWDSGGGKGHITGTVDEDKFKEDLQRVKDKASAPGAGKDQ